MKKIIGPAIFLVVAAVFAVLHFTGDDEVTAPRPKSRITVNAFVGGEKMSFLNNPEVIEILDKRHGIQLSATKAGSIEMVTELSFENTDALWPSNQIAVEIFRNRGGQFISEETIFNSPIVLYAYDIVADALAAQQLVEKKGEVHYFVDFSKFLDWISQGKKWADIGLPQLYGGIGIYSTDPTQSNSGNMFAGLLANMYNGGNVVTPQQSPDILQKVIDYFRSRGHMERSSGDIFKNFITTGVGARPIIVGYESQLVEFTIENQKYADYLKQKIRTLYPIPTVWSSHPVIALTSSGKRFLEALKDPDLQKIAWEGHGFRSGLMGIENDPAVLKATGIPKDITAVIPLPEASIMETLIDSLKSG